MSSVGEEKFSALFRSLAGPKNWMDIRQISKRKAFKLRKDFTCIWGLPQENEDVKSDQSRKLLYLSDKQWICEKLTRLRGWGRSSKLWGSDWEHVEEFNKVCLCGFLSFDPPSWWGECLPSYREGTSHRGALSPAWRRNRWIRVSVSNLLCPQNNEDTQVASFGCRVLTRSPNPVVCICQSCSLDTYTLCCILFDHFCVRLTFLTRLYAP